MLNAHLKLNLSPFISVNLIFQQNKKVALTLKYQGS